MQNSRKINTEDYFDVNLLDRKEGKVSSNQKLIRFGDLYIEIDAGNFKKSDLDKIDVPENFKSESEFISESEVLARFTPSKVVHANVMRYPNEEKLHWLLAISTENSKKEKKLTGKNYSVMIFAAGTLI